MERAVRGDEDARVPLRPDGDARAEPGHLARRHGPRLVVELPHAPEHKRARQTLSRRVATAGPAAALIKALICFVAAEPLGEPNERIGVHVAVVGAENEVVGVDERRAPVDGQNLRRERAHGGRRRPRARGRALWRGLSREGARVKHVAVALGRQGNNGVDAAEPPGADAGHSAERRAHPPPRAAHKQQVTSSRPSGEKCANFVCKKIWMCLCVGVCTFGVCMLEFFCGRESWAVRGYDVQ
jgi:hypothetical protein